MPSTSPAVSAPASRTTTTRCSVMNGGLPAALSSAATAASRPSAPPAASVSSPAPARPGMVISSSARRAVVAAEQLGDEVVDDAVAQRRVGALDQVRRRHAHAAASRSEQRFDHAADRDRTGDVVHPHDAAAVRDAVRDRRQRRRAAVVDVEVEQLAEEPLVRRRQQQRVAVRGERVALAQQHRALRRRLAEVEAGVERDLLRGEAGGLGPRARGRAGTR